MGGSEMFSLVKRFLGGGRAPRQAKRRPTLNGEVTSEFRPILRAKKPPAADLLDNPDLSLDTTQDEGFDPYNTGTFNRSGSWERINRRRNS